MQKKYQLTVIVTELVLLVLLSVVMGTYTAILLMALTSGCYGSILNFEIKLELRNIFFICMVIFIYLMVNMDVLSVGNKMKIADNG
jgi:hypothetical protein